MWNLKCVSIEECQLYEWLPLTATTWDSSTGDIICAFGPTKAHQTIELKRLVRSHEPSSGLISIVAWDSHFSELDSGHDRIISLQYFVDYLATCIVLEGGDIIIVRENPQYGEEKIEILGTVDEGISGASWAPDEEILAVVTKLGNLIYMTRDFEIMTSVPLRNANIETPKQVSVGWGKKETQFQGKRVRALKDPTVPEYVDEGKLSNNDTKDTFLSWRGDGAFLAINSIHSGARRAISVYSRDGSLDSISEPVDYMEGAVSWRPVGNIIAGVQRLKGRVDIIFFEKNGLRHGQFSLRLTEEELASRASNIKLLWNPDSTILAVQLMDSVQLWTMGNYHYYLKQEIPVCCTDSGSVDIQTFTWNQEKPLCLCFASSNILLNINLAFEINRGSTAPPDDFGEIAVIDGRILRLTALRMATIPPPMCAHEVSLEHNAVDVAFSKSGTQFAVLTYEGISIYSWDLKAKPSREPSLRHFLHFSNKNLRPLNMCFFGEKKLYITKTTDFGCEVQELNVENEQFITTLQIHNSYGISIFADVCHRSIWVSEQGRNQRIYSLFTTEDGNVPSFNAENDIPSNHDICWAAAVQSTKTENTLFTLSTSGNLYANKQLISRNCTSFVVTDVHLIFTTTQNLLKFIHLMETSNLIVPGDDVSEDNERCRGIERGARLVSAMPSAFALTLQMPRGNLENIYPRALVLAGIRRYIDNENYRAAYMICRNHIVDMNILHDYKPQQFMSNINLFINQIRKAEFIDEFLSQLRNENVSATLYKDTFWLPGLEKPCGKNSLQRKDPQTNKVNGICNAFIAELEKRVDADVRNLVTAYICKSPADLEAGLKLVSRLKDHGEEQAQQAVEHMCFLSDVNKLYEHALGSYDIELALMVAQQTHQDPKEYLPFLQHLQELPVLYRRYEIDNHLGNYQKALASLHTLAAHEEVKKYTIRHSLYTNALDLYRYQPVFQREISSAYADYLYSQSNYEEAAILYESLEMYEPAYRCYKLVNLWTECIYCAKLVPLDNFQMRELTLSLADILSSVNKDYISAATIYAEHLLDIPMAARLLCYGAHYADACRLLSLHKQELLIGEIVDSSLGKATADLISLFADFQDQLQIQVSRIFELRELRASDPLAFFGGDASSINDSGDIPDNISLAPTTSTTVADRSIFTRYTAGTSASHKSSKNRRKEERKRARGKKGTVYEEEYLVNSVRRLVERVNNTIPEVEAITQGLLRRAMREQALRIRHNFKDVLTKCESGVSHVFGGIVDNEEISTQRLSDNSGTIVGNSAGLMSKQGNDSLPVVGKIKRMALIDG